LVEQAPLQFVFLDDQTTFTDNVSFAVEVHSPQVRCFDLQKKLYLKTYVAPNQVTCAFASEIQLRLDKYCISNAARVIKIQLPTVENLSPNDVFSSDSIMFAVKKDSLDSRIWQCNLLIESVYSSQSCEFNLHLSQGVYPAFFFLSTADLVF
jgi:hypothetical protein